MDPLTQWPWRLPFLFLVHACFHADHLPRGVAGSRHDRWTRVDFVVKRMRGREVIPGLGDGVARYAVDVGSDQSCRRLRLRAAQWTQLLHVHLLEDLPSAFPVHSRHRWDALGDSYP